MENCCGASGGCSESSWPDADAREQALLMGAGVLFALSGGYAVRRYKPRWFFPWLSGLLAWATVPKYFICTRCENYGKSCDFFYGGRYAARLFKKQDRPFNAAGYFAEGASLGVFQLLPALAARRAPAALIAYLMSAAAFQALLIRFCCIDCVRFAKDPWKARYCPTHKLVRALRLSGREQAD